MGNTEAYRQSMEGVQKMIKEEMEKMKESEELPVRNLARSMDKGTRGKEVRALIALHYKGIQFFYDYPLKMYRGMGKMYVDDPRFGVYYDRLRPGLAVFVRDAIAYFCDIRKSRA